MGRENYGDSFDIGLGTVPKILTRSLCHQWEFNFIGGDQIQLLVLSNRFGDCLFLNILLSVESNGACIFYSFGLVNGGQELVHFLLVQRLGGLWGCES